MLLQIIKKTVRQRVQLITIIINKRVGTFLLLVTSFFSYSQPIDTLKLKEVIENELTRQGLQNPKFELNVKSINQSGGQTAFIINNVYGDTSFNIADKDNFAFKNYNYYSNDGIIVYPKKGKWDKPFCIYPKMWMKNTNSKMATIVNGGPVPPNNSMKLHRMVNSKLVEYDCTYYTFLDPCSYSLPLFIQVDYSLGFFIFGDFSDENKWYIYTFNEVKHCTEFKGKFYNPSRN